MARYIDADKAAKMASNHANSYIPCLSEYEEGCADTWENAADFIKHFESEDVAPVVHAHWEDVPHYRGRKRCSKCKEYAPSFQCGAANLSKYCPYCGGKMDEEAKSMKSKSILQEMAQEDGLSMEVIQSLKIEQNVI